VGFQAVGMDDVRREFLKPLTQLGGKTPEGRISQQPAGHCCKQSATAVAQLGEPVGHRLDRATNLPIPQISQQGAVRKGQHTRFNPLTARPPGIQQGEQHALGATYLAHRGKKHDLHSPAANRE